MAKAKEIQNRIRAINNTKKITKAMEMVAATKMRKSIEAVLATRTYANLSWTTVINLSKNVDPEKTIHPLLAKKKEVKKVAILLLTSNRGLCGGFNSAIINKMYESILRHTKNEKNEEIEHEIIVVGKKGLSMASRYGYKVVAEFPKLDMISEVKEVQVIARMLINDFLTGRYDKIMVAFTDYISASKQIARVKQLLPIDIIADKDHHLGIMGKDTRVSVTSDFVSKKEEKYLKDEKKYVYTFTFEPNPYVVLNEMLPRLIEVQLFQALLESNASEHSARMTAMHKASEAATDLAKELKLYYNKARQAAITNEIAEISAGADALK